MKKYFLFGCAVLLAGCSHGQLSSLPKIQDNNAAEVIIIRENQFWGGGVTAIVSLDNQDIIAIRAGDHSKIKLKAGQHAIAVRDQGGFSSEVHDSVLLDCIDKNKYYLKMWKGISSRFNIKVVPETEGEELVKDTNFLELKQ